MSRMNGQLDVTGARRHVYIYMMNEMSAKIFVLQTALLDDNEKDDFSKRERENKNINETG